MKITEFRIELCNFFIKKTGIKKCEGNLQGLHTVVELTKKMIDYI